MAGSSELWPTFLENSHAFRSVFTANVLVILNVMCACPYHEYWIVSKSHVTCLVGIGIVFRLGAHEYLPTQISDLINPGNALTVRRSPGWTFQGWTGSGSRPIFRLKCSRTKVGSRALGDKLVLFRHSENGALSEPGRFDFALRRLLHLDFSL